MPPILLGKYELLFYKLWSIEEGRGQFKVLVQVSLCTLLTACHTYRISVGTLLGMTAGQQSTVFIFLIFVVLDMHSGTKSNSNSLDISLA